MAHDHRNPIVVTPFCTIPSNDERTRQVFITESRKGRAVRIETYAKDGKQVAGTLYLFRSDLPAFLAALTAAAAAIGVEIPTEPDHAGLDRYLTRARAL